MNKDYLLLIDGSSLLSTQYYGNLPKEIQFAKTEEEKEKHFNKIMQTRKGVYTNAIYGFMRTFSKILKEQKPSFVAVAWDKSRNTFRREIYADYKGNRGNTPLPLKQQFELCENILEEMGIKQFMDDRYEADDFCGTLSSLFEKDVPVRILTKDNDYLQLVSDNTNLWLMHSTAKKTEELCQKYGLIADGTFPDRVFPLTPELVKKEFGVEPESVNSLKGLQGDSSDNIKGVQGVGPATAVALIAEYKNVTALYDDIRNLDEKGKKEKAAEWKTRLGISRSPLNYLLKESDGEPVGEEAALLSEKLATIKRDVPLDVKLEDLRLSINFSAANRIFEELEFKSISLPDPNEKEKEEIKKERKAVNDFSEICELFDKLAKCEYISLSPLLSKKNEPEYDRENNRPGVLGLALCDEKESYFIEISGFVSVEFIAERIAELDRKGCIICSGDIKRVLRAFDIKELVNGFDTGVAGYLLNPLNSELGIESLSMSYLDRRITSLDDLTGKRTVMESFEEDGDKVREWAYRQAECTYDLYEILTEKLKETEMLELYEKIEYPLIHVLNDMEKTGILVVKEQLREFGETLQKDIERLEEEIYSDCGEKFNINSPKQLGVILFEKLKLPNGKKTKTGYSTSAEVLEKLKVDEPVVGKILDYRQLTKLKSTYADGLNEYIDNDGRIRTTFNQTVTATGRLSSTEPNLQNIPIRMELGRELRKVFVPKPGCLFVDADYSQIELRILAALSGDSKLIEAYRNSEDIHASTAAAVFKVSPENVTKELRSRAKAVNFGIVYGISSFGLGTGLNISKKEAEGYIEGYFETYPGVKKYLDDAVASAAKNGYSITYFGRRRPIPELESTNFMQKSFGERVAMNSPVQGTAADIIKLAMLKVYERLEKENPASKLLLQIHDELLIETPLEDVQKVKAIVEEEMKNAVNLAVGLEVGIEEGKSWFEAH